MRPNPISTGFFRKLNIFFRRRGAACPALNLGKSDYPKLTSMI